MCVPGLASTHEGISTQGWFIGLMCAIALLTLIVLVACFVNRNKGGKYSGRCRRARSSVIIFLISQSVTGKKTPPEIILKAVTRTGH